MWGEDTLILKEITSALLSFNIREKIGDEKSLGKGLVVMSNKKCERNKSISELRNNKALSKSRKRKDIQCYKC